MEQQKMKWQIVLSAVLLAVLIGNMFFPVFEITGEKYISSAMRANIYAEKSNPNVAEKAGTKRLIEDYQKKTESWREQAEEFDQKMERRVNQISGIQFIQWGFSTEKNLDFPCVVYVKDIKNSGVDTVFRIMAILLLLPILLAIINLIFILVRRKTYPGWLGITALVEILCQLIFLKLMPGLIWTKIATYVESFSFINKETLQIPGTGKYAIQSMVREFVSAEFYVGMAVGMALLLASIVFMTVCRPVRIEKTQEKGGINMYCNQCGNRLSEEAVFCPNCGQPVDRMQQYFSSPGRPHIQTVFSGLIYEKTRGAYWEFGIWVAVCVLAVLTLMAGVSVDGESYLRSDFRTFWMFLLILEIGYALFITFRQRILAIYYSVIVFFFVMLIPYFNCEKQIYSTFLNAIDEDAPVSLWVIYVLALLTVIGLIICLSVHIFSRFQLNLPVMILGIIMMGFITLLGICSYVVPAQNYRDAYRKELMDRSSGETYIREHLEEHSEKIKEYYKEASNGLGTTAYVGVCLMSGAYLLLFFWGVIDNRKQKFDLGKLFYQGQQWQNSYDFGVRSQTPGAIIPQPMVNYEPCIQFLRGIYAGRTIRIQGEVILGSAQGKAHIVLPENTISAQHCVIRFNRETQNYEIRDLSKNGIFTQEGIRLQRGLYLACARGTQLYLGSRNCQICLK